MCNFCCCHLWAKLHVQIGRILHISSRLCLRRGSECERLRKQQHTRIAKVMGNYKGTGWQLWLQSSEPDEATYFCCQLACTWERICDTQTVHSLYRSSSYPKASWNAFMVDHIQKNINTPFQTSYFKDFFSNLKNPIIIALHYIHNNFFYLITWITVVVVFEQIKKLVHPIIHSSTKY